MNDRSLDKRSGRLVGGLVLMTLGAIFLLAHFDVLPEHAMATYWPCILLAVGLGKLLAPCESDRRGGGLWLIFIGLWAQASILHWFGLSWHNSWPLFLIFAGLRVLTSELWSRRGANHAG